MPTDYELAVLKARKELSMLTLAKQKELLAIYNKSTNELAHDLAIKTPKNKYALFSTLLERENDLKVKIQNKITDATQKAAAKGTEPDAMIAKQIFGKFASDTKTVYSAIQENVVKDILAGNLYKDGKTLSERVWGVSTEYGNDLQYIIASGLQQQKSAQDLAWDLQWYVKPAAERPTTWGTSYPKLKNKAVDYNAMRLARTSINHAYQTASIQSSQANPFCEEIEWRASLAHGRTCDLCISRHGVRFPKNNVPLDHPNGLCTMLPVVPDPRDVADELRDWLDGGDNKKLDDWYKKDGWKFGGLTPDKTKPIDKKIQAIQKKIDKVTNQMNQLAAGDDLIPGASLDITYEEYATGAKGMAWEKSMLKAYQKQLKTSLHDVFQIEIDKLKPMLDKADEYKKLYKAKQKLISDLAAANIKPNPLLQPLMQQAKQLTDELDDLVKKQYVNIWKNPVTAADYQSLSDQGSVIAKKQYFYGKLQKATDPNDIKKWQDLLDDLEDFIIKGQDYSTKDTLYQTINQQIRAISNPGKADAYTKARKDAAYWFKDGNTKQRADDLLRPKTGQYWRKMSRAEKEAAYKYTGGSGSFNRPLRGYQGGWSDHNYVGPGKVSLNYEGSGQAIKDLEKALDNLSYDFDIWLQRGVEDRGTAKFLGITEHEMTYDDITTLRKKLVGKVVKDEAFWSTSPVKGGGFSGNIFNAYAPKGTNMIYAEPFSAYGRGAELSWDGISKQSAFGGEFEVIVQKGYHYKITKVERKNGRLFIDVDILDR